MYHDFKLDVPNELLLKLRQYNEKMIQVKRRFSDENVNISVWNTNVLNQYTTHQVYKNIFIIEIDKMRLDNLYYYLQDNTNELVLMKNSFDIDYLVKNGALYLSNLPKKSPIQRKQSTQLNYVSFPKAEKILVDVFVYNKTILPYDLSEIENIYRNMYKRHIIKTKTVLHYAKLRGPKLYVLVSLGARRKDIASICLLETFVICLTSLLLSSIVIANVCNYLNKIFYCNFFVYDFVAFLLLTIVVSGIFIIATWLPLFKLLVKQPIDLVKEKNE